MMQEDNVALVYDLRTIGGLSVGVSLLGVRWAIASTKSGLLSALSDQSISWSGTVVPRFRVVPNSPLSLTYTALVDVHRFGHPFLRLLRLSFFEIEQSRAMHCT